MASVSEIHVQIVPDAAGLQDGVLDGMLMLLSDEAVERLAALIAPHLERRAARAHQRNAG